MVLTRLKWLLPEYNPVSDNSTAEGRSANRRTRIVILPQLDQFFKLLETK